MSLLFMGLVWKRYANSFLVAGCKRHSLRMLCLRMSRRRALSSTPRQRSTHPRYRLRGKMGLELLCAFVFAKHVI